MSQTLAVRRHKEREQCVEEFDRVYDFFALEQAVCADDLVPQVVLKHLMVGEQKLEIPREFGCDIGIEVRGMRDELNKILQRNQTTV